MPLEAKPSYGVRPRPSRLHLILTLHVNINRHCRRKTLPVKTLPCVLLVERQRTLEQLSFVSLLIHSHADVASLRQLKSWSVLIDVMTLTLQYR